MRSVFRARGELANLADGIRGIERLNACNLAPMERRGRLPDAYRMPIRSVAIAWPVSTACVAQFRPGLPLFPTQAA
ncbi:hypothetical protein WI41_10845 [Burkholderia latens]|uniref:Uncharacterized protein n=1 Tax=Burkholderia latens TaxID=488446 RepID=A0AAP1C716_9BURK|nr:hypothetical protein WI41_10845 [Burkholderia latens]